MCTATLSDGKPRDISDIWPRGLAEVQAVNIGGTVGTGHIPFIYSAAHTNTSLESSMLNAVLVLALSDHSLQGIALSHK